MGKDEKDRWNAVSFYEREAEQAAVFHKKSDGKTSCADQKMGGKTGAFFDRSGSYSISDRGNAEPPFDDRRRGISRSASASFPVQFADRHRDVIHRYAVSEKGIRLFSDLYGMAGTGRYKLRASGFPDDAAECYGFQDV